MLVIALGAAEAASAVPAPVFEFGKRSLGASTVPQLIDGARVVSDERVGTHWRLADRSHVEISGIQLSTDEGSIDFWLKPQWGDRDPQSHVLLTARWNDGRQGYLAASYGWWEPQGSRRLYFVVNNQQEAHCGAPFLPTPDEWVHVSLVWRSGASGYCAIYLGTERIAESRPALAGHQRSTGPLFVGSDLGSTDPRKRPAEFSLADFRVFDRALGESEIRVLSHSAGTLRFSSEFGDPAWMKSTLARPAAEVRAPDGQLREIRALFDEDIHWAYSRESTDQILKKIQSAGFNVYVPCVWHGRGAYFPTTIAAIDSRLPNIVRNGDDPLRYLIQRAHEMGIEIHPWFTVALRENEEYPDFHPDGTPDGAFDVHNPDFRDFIVRLMLDVVSRYDIDGINLDYIRAMGICTSSPCKASYEARYKTSLIADNIQRVFSADARRRVEAWQDDAVSDIVERLSDGTRKLKPNAIISVDSHPVPRSEKRPLEGRNDIAWADRDWIDVIFAMDYRKRIDDARIDAVRDSLKNPKKLLPLFGNYERVDGRTVPRSAALVSRYIDFARRKWPGNGFGFYIYSMLSAEQIRALQAGPFREAAAPFWSRAEQVEIPNAVAQP